MREEKISNFFFSHLKPSCRNPLGCGGALFDKLLKSLGWLINGSAGQISRASTTAGCKAPACSATGLA
jgi:hypothetical protein